MSEELINQRWAIQILESERQNLIRIIKARDKELETLKAKVSVLKHKRGELYNTSMRLDTAKTMKAEPTSKEKRNRLVQKSPKKQLEIFKS